MWTVQLDSIVVEVQIVCNLQMINSSMSVVAISTILTCPLHPQWDVRLQQDPYLRYIMYYQIVILQCFYLQE